MKMKVRNRKIQSNCSTSPYPSSTHGGVLGVLPVLGVAPKVKPAGAGAVVLAAVPLPNVCVVLAPQVTAIVADESTDEPRRAPWLWSRRRWGGGRGGRGGRRGAQELILLVHKVPMHLTLNSSSLLRLSRALSWLGEAATMMGQLLPPLTPQEVCAVLSICPGMHRTWR